MSIFGPLDGKKKRKYPTMKCTWCGRFISYEDLRTGKATNIMVTPDSHYSFEEWESNCKKCNDKD